MSDNVKSLQGIKQAQLRRDQESFTHARSKKIVKILSLDRPVKTIRRQERTWRARFACRAAPLPVQGLASLSCQRLCLCACGWKGDTGGSRAEPGEALENLQGSCDLHAPVNAAKSAPMYVCFHNISS